MINICGIKLQMTQNKINLDKSVIINGSDLLDENIELALETTKNRNIPNMIKFKHVILDYLGH